MGPPIVNISCPAILVSYRQYLARVHKKSSCLKTAGLLCKLFLHTTLFTINTLQLLTQENYKRAIVEFVLQENKSLLPFQAQGNTSTL